MKRELQYEVTEEEDGLRLDQYIAGRCMDLSRSYIQKLIKESRVTINKNIQTKTKTAVQESDIVNVSLPDPKELEIKPQDIPLDILYEDNDVLVVNKPKGMVVHPAPGHYEDTLVNAVLYHCRDNLSGINGVLRPGIVHRIDKDTTGALIVCKNDKAHQKIADQLRAHTITRSYRAIVYNNFSEDEGMINAPIGRHPTNRKKRMVTEKNSKEAITHYKVLDHLNHKFNYIECRLETGRTHQIRVHMSHIGHPLLGDEVYGPVNSKFKNLQGQTLHAATIGFIHPTTEEYMEFSAPLPDYFEKLLKTLA
ncbi:MAG: RluA family pseudouridine synthase [Roseburia sp.]|jgi:23S rRNA pseudouridine1911/1915/1917 synthase|nr:RluA family pseudouridine synthase [Roseburia sp.]